MEHLVLMSWSLGAVVFVAIHAVAALASGRRWNGFDTAAALTGAGCALAGLVVILGVLPEPGAIVLGAGGAAAIVLVTLAWRHAAPPISLVAALVVLIGIGGAAAMAESGLGLMVVIFAGPLIWNLAYLIGAGWAAYRYSGGYGHTPGSCRSCGYSTRGLSGNRCPECGAPV